MGNGRNKGLGKLKEGSVFQANDMFDLKFEIQVLVFVFLILRWKVGNDNFPIKLPIQGFGLILWALNWATDKFHIFFSDPVEKPENRTAGLLAFIVVQHPATIKTKNKN